MSCKEETKNINGSDYYVIQWPAEKSLLMKFKLARIFGPAMEGISAALLKIVGAGSIDELKSGKIKIEDLPIDALFSSISLLFEKNNPESVLKLMREVVFSANREGVRLSNKNFDEVYTNNLLEFYQAFFFVLRVNYSSFFAGRLDGLLTKSPKEGLDQTQ